MILASHSLTPDPKCRAPHQQEVYEMRCVKDYENDSAVNTVALHPNQVYIYVCVCVCVVAIYQLSLFVNESLLC